VETSFEKTSFLLPEIGFISRITPYEGENLLPVLNNSFKRLTLIHKEKLDRCTIDICPVFNIEKNTIELKNLGVFELKRGKSLKSSPVVNILRNLKIRQRGMSKYCTGRALLEPELKQNAFKPRLRFLYKEILNKETTSYDF
jgi:hypothetical protein